MDSAQAGETGSNARSLLRAALRDALGFDPAATFGDHDGCPDRLDVFRAILADTMSGNVELVSMLRWSISFIAASLTAACGGGSNVEPSGHLADAAGDVAACAFDAPTRCPTLIVSQIATVHFAFDGPTIYLSVLNDRLFSAPKLGGPTTLLAQPPYAPYELIARGPLLYYAIPSVSGASNAGVFSLPTKGGTPTGLVTGLAEGPRIAVDDAYLYYSERVPGRVSRIALSSPAPVPELLVEATTPAVVTVGSDALYFAESKGGFVLNRLTLSTKSSELVFVDSDLAVPRPVVRNDDVYWFSSVRGDLMHTTTHGGTPELVFHGKGSDVAGFAQLGVHGSYAYVFDANDTLYRVSLTTGAPEVLVRNVKVADLFVDDSGVYFVVSQRGVYRLSL